MIEYTMQLIKSRRTFGDKQMIISDAMFYLVNKILCLLKSTGEGHIVV